MFSNLPEHIQHQILSYLETNNFQAAKELRDHWKMLEAGNENFHEMHEEE